ncbi:hypothetical protein [Thioalkalivibrio sp. ALJT]|uniref:hypothetical protein n=1 Tax=Thioalkalivibrio sp. ALJT TaxID=1158146 RepID=UPI0012DCEB43|nr:hypothetical protein [Thioalkalivibrio sp. ALJT]
MANENVRAVYFPYCIQKQEDGSWLLLNRNYKPVGFNTGDWITYSDFPVSMKVKGLGPDTLRKLSCHDEEPGDRVYLYNDGTVPTGDAKAMAAYLKRLEILLNLESA